MSAPVANYNFSRPITKSDTVDHAWGPFDAIYVGTTGDVVVVLDDNLATTQTLVGVPAGATIPIRGKRVNSTSTTASNMLGLKQV